MLKITAQIQIAETELREQFTCSPGPGGQNVNKVATAVQLWFDVAHSPSLPDEMRERVLQLAGRRVVADGVLLIEAHRFRTRERNRQDARERLAAVLRQAAVRPKQRIATRPTRSSERERLEIKRRNSATKRLRSGPVVVD
jgi:ribosome-associated protein